MTKLISAILALGMGLSAFEGEAAQDPTLACGAKKVKILVKYDKCLDKALPSVPLDKRFDKIAKCHDKCTKGFTKAEEKYTECAQEGPIGIADFCGPGSDTFAYADCRQDFFYFGASGCYP